MNLEELKKQDANGRLENKISSIRSQIRNLEEELQIYMLISRDPNTFNKFWKAIKDRD